MSDLIADLVMELIGSAFERGMDGAGPDDRRIDREARAVNAIRRGDEKAMRRALERYRKENAEQAADLERMYGKRDR